MALSKIKTASIADDAVTSAKVATGGIATVDMADGTVTSLKIADGAIATADLADGAVTPVKLSTGGPVWNTSGTITAGSASSTGGSVLIQNKYSDPHYPTIFGEEYSSGAPFIGFAVKPSTTDTGVTSSASNASWNRAFIKVGGGSYALRVGYSPTSSTIAIGTTISDATIGLQMDYAGNIGINGPSQGAKLGIVTISTAIDPYNVVVPARTSGLEVYNSSQTAGAYSALSLGATTDGTGRFVSLVAQSNAASSYTPDLLFMQRFDATTSVERARLDYLGNFKVGYISLANAQSSQGMVMSNMRWNGVTQKYMKSYTGASWAGGWAIGSQGGGYGDILFYNQNWGTTSTDIDGSSLANIERMRIDTSGRVGIGGQFSPQAELHITAPGTSGSSSGTLSLSGTGGGSYIKMGNKDSGATAGPAVIWSANRQIGFARGDDHTNRTGGNLSTVVTIDVGSSASTQLTVSGATSATTSTATTSYVAWDGYNYATGSATADSNWYTVFSGLNGHHAYEFAVDAGASSFHDTGFIRVSGCYASANIYSQRGGGEGYSNATIQIRVTGSTYNWNIEIRTAAADPNSPRTNVYWRAKRLYI